MLTVFLFTSALVIMCVFVHYEVLVSVAKLRRKFGITHRRWIINLILCALIAHVFEISIFALGYSIMDPMAELGHLIDKSGADSTDYWYFSAVTYTSLGFGDITPDGPMRFAVGVETLTGLVLIAWTSSMVFVEMQNSWKDQDS